MLRCNIFGKLFSKSPENGSDHGDKRLVDKLQTTNHE